MLVKAPFTSVTADEHMKALRAYYPKPVSADSSSRSDNPEENYCVGGGLCRYMLGEINDWDVLAGGLIDTQNIIEENSESPEDINFPNAHAIGEALWFIYRHYNVRKLTDYDILNSDEQENFWIWLALYLTHRNDLKYFGEAWHVIASIFNGNQEVIERFLESYRMETMTGRSMIFRSEEN